MDDRPGHGRLGVGLGRADRHEAGRRVRQEAIRPRLVDPAVEGDDRRDGEGAGEDEAGELEMGVDDIERAGLAQDGQLGRQEVRGRLRREAERSERAGHDRHEPRRRRGVAAGEECHVVTAPAELGDERRDDPLGAAVGGRGNGFERRSDLGDAERWDGHRSESVICRPRRRFSGRAATLHPPLSAGPTGFSRR